LGDPFFQRCPLPKIKFIVFLPNAKKKEFQYPFRSLLLWVILVPAVSILGYYLAYSGVLLQSKGHQEYRTLLEKQNRSMRKLLFSAEKQNRSLENDMDNLAGTNQKVDQLNFYKESQLSESQSSWFTFDIKDFFSSPSQAMDPYLLAKQLESFLDSTLDLLQRYPDLALFLPVVSPVDTNCIVIRRYGPAWDPFLEKSSDHRGVDFSCADNPAVYAPGAGRVVSVYLDPLFGLSVRLFHTSGIETIYSHLKKASVGPGQIVQRGQVLGEMGQSGLATGIHLHYEIMRQGFRVDPLTFLVEGPKLARHLVQSDPPDRSTR